MELSKAIQEERKARLEGPGTSGTQAQADKDDTTNETVKQLNEQVIKKSLRLLTLRSF